MDGGCCFPIQLAGMSQRFCCSRMFCRRAEDAADLALGDETNGPLGVKEVSGSVLLRNSIHVNMSVVLLLSLFAAVAADRVATRSGDSLRCVRPDDDAFSTHAKFCRYYIPTCLELGLEGYYLLPLPP
jgi:hypothetical protein